MELDRIQDAEVPGVEHILAVSRRIVTDHERVAGIVADQKAGLLRADQFPVIDTARRFRERAAVMLILFNEAQPRKRCDWIFVRSDQNHIVLQRIIAVQIGQQGNDVPLFQGYRTQFGHHQFFLARSNPRFFVLAAVLHRLVIPLNRSFTDAHRGWVRSGKTEVGLG
ncbi:hypothetical protein D1872_239040 [compost metagenome]